MELQTNTIYSTRLRCIIGWLGMLLPWIVVILLGYFPGSISSTYYTYAGASFMIILGSAAILLFCYKGYDLTDDIINTVAGLAALMICLFPCYEPNVGEHVGTFQIDINVSDVLHCIGAATFFAMLSIDSLFRFVKSSGELTPNKKKRNVIYRICGVGMLLSFSLFALPAFPAKVWLIEAIALFFFGLSWLTKADRYPWLFADDPSDLYTVIKKHIQERKNK